MCFAVSLSNFLVEEDLPKEKVSKKGNKSGTGEPSAKMIIEELVPPCGHVMQRVAILGMNFLA